MLATRNDMARRALKVEMSDRQPTAAPTRYGWPCGNRMRCLPGSPGRTWTAHLKSSAAAAVLAVPYLILPTAAADAACKTSGYHAQYLYPADRTVAATVDPEATMTVPPHHEVDDRRCGATIPLLDDGPDGGKGTLTLSNPRESRITNPTATVTTPDGDRSSTAWLANFGRTLASRLADRLGEHLTAGIRNSYATLGRLRVGPRRSHEEEEPAGIATIDRGRWRDWTWDSFAHVVGDGSTRTGLKDKTDRDLLLGSSFLSAAGDCAATVRGWSGSGQEAPKPFAGAHRSSGAESLGLFEADCERGRRIAEVAPSYRVGHCNTSAPDRYELGDSLSTVHPYVRAALTEW